MTGWTEFTFAFLLFFASHVVPAYPAIRHRLIGWLGKAAYLTVFSALSLALLAWLIVASSRAPYVVVWDFSPWQMWVPNIAMPFVCVLLAFGIAAPNPLSVASRADQSFDPEHPGIAGVARHPILMALAIWALAHLVPNGDVAHVLLFGIFAAFALIGMYAIDVRKRREHGTAAWQRLSRRTSLIPFASIIAGRWLPHWRGVDPVRAALAIALYAVLLALHRPLIGASPFPPL